MTAPRRRRGRPLHGWLLLDKPVGLGSTDAVRAIKRSLSPTKIGHAGTLDPLASGLLPIALGEATKTIPYLVDSSKSYRFTVAWGTATRTDDREGEVIARSDQRPDTAAIEALLPRFLGVIAQRPPAYSAIKVDGARSYDLARSGQLVELAERPVRCDRLTLIATSAEAAELEVHCGKGFYVRSLARDLALALGTVGHVTHLRRLHVGPFALGQAIGPFALENEPPDAHRRRLLGSLLPLDAALDDIPAVRLDQSSAVDLRQGRPIPADGSAAPRALAFHQGLAVAIIALREGWFWPVRVFNLPADQAGDQEE